MEIDTQLSPHEKAVISFYQTLERKLLRRFFLWCLSIAGVAVFALVPFYYNTNSNVEYLKENTRQNTQSIKELTVAINNISQPQAVNIVEIKNLDEKIKSVKDDQNRIENKVDKLDEKIDKLTELMIKRK